MRDFAKSSLVRLEENKNWRKTLLALTYTKIVRYIFIIVAAIKSRMERENP